MSWVGLDALEWPRARSTVRTLQPCKYIFTLVVAYPRVVSHASRGVTMPGLKLSKLLDIGLRDR